MDRLQIIGPDGNIIFYTLDPAKGFTNIGQDPANDIVLADPNVAPFHAVLTHRQKPLQALILSDQGRVALNEQSLPLNQARPMQHLQCLELGDYTLILFEDQAATAPVTTPLSPQRAQPAPPPVIIPFSRSIATPPLPAPALARPFTVTPPTTRPEPTLAGTEGVPLDLEDEVIITELLTREIEVDVEQTATYQLTIINGGDLVATFTTWVEGLDDAWVNNSRPMLNLFEGNRATVTITVTPPRQPTSFAGAHTFSIVVASDNYPGRVSRRTATLVIHPYYEFSVGEINPRQQSISWFKRNARATVPLTNRGNSQAKFQVDGRDDERGCSFEFEVPDEDTNLANQADFRIPPSQTMAVPMVITPHARQLVALRRRSYAYTITTSLPDSTLSPRSMLGQLKTAPLIGPLILLLLSLLTVILVIYIFKPRIYTFNADGSVTRVITGGQEVMLNWNASPFSRLIIPELGAEPLESAQGSIKVVPTANATFQLKADNWLSNLSQQWFGVNPRVVSIILTPVPPKIVVFGGDKQNIVTGENVMLSWQVENADKVSLVNQADSNPKPLPGFNGTLDTGPLEQQTVYYLEASNPYIATPIRSDPFTIRVSTPTPTPQPTPAIVKFFANPPVIMAGENTTIEWEVTGVDKVSVQGIGDSLPPAQSVVKSLLETTNYVLNASNGASATKPQPLTVWVTPAPTPTPPPNAPQIRFFTADPDTLLLLKGAQGSVALSWSVTGKVTNVELSGPTLSNPISGLQPESTVNMSVDKSTLFVLTAYNQDAKVSTNLEIKVNEPTPTPVPPTPPPPTATPIPPAEIILFQISAPGAPKVQDLGGGKYQVQENTAATFKWQVDKAAKITFQPDEGDSKEVSPIGQTAQNISVPSVGQDRNYLLVAENSVGQRTTAAIVVTVVDPPPPDPPYTVTGVEDVAGNKNTINWQWNNDPNKDKIIGFRVYRAVVPGGSFALIPGADEAALGVSVRQYGDAVSPTCGHGYYVVAVYQDVLGSSHESPASLNSWYSTPCP